MEKKDLRVLSGRYSEEFVECRRKLWDALAEYVIFHGHIEGIIQETVVWVDGAGYVVVCIKKIRYNHEGFLVLEDDEGNEYGFESLMHDTLLDICCCID